MSLYHHDYLDQNSYTESIITYLMFHSGYLTARKSDDGRYLFKIPNEEVRDEFHDVIEEQIDIISRSKDHDLQLVQESFITTNALYKKFMIDSFIIKAAELMLSKKIEELSNLFMEREEKICANSDSNLFSIAIINNDINSFHVLLKNCDHQDLDKIYHGLTSVDFAYLLKKDKIVAELSILGRESKKIEAPVWYKNIYCNFALFTSASFKYLAKQIVGKEDPFLYKLSNLFLSI